MSWYGPWSGGGWFGPWFGDVGGGGPPIDPPAGPPLVYCVRLVDGAAGVRVIDNSVAVTIPEGCGG